MDISEGPSQLVDVCPLCPPPPVTQVEAQQEPLEVIVTKPNPDEEPEHHVVDQVDDDNRGS